jgi:hypothetical protein
MSASVDVVFSPSEKPAELRSAGAAGACMLMAKRASRPRDARSTGVPSLVKLMCDGRIVTGVLGVDIFCFSRQRQC